MRNRVVWMGIGCLCAGLGGCGEQASDGTSNSAEVPQPGPAAIEQDIGPAPEGQTEPPIPESLPAPEIDTPEDTPTNEPDASGAEANATSGEGVTLSMATWDEGQQLVASQTGRVVVLDLWSTTCVPCRKEFPHFVQLHRDRGDEVACIAYSFDYSGRASRPPESYRDKVLEFLEQQGATFDNLLGTDDPDPLHDRLDLAAIPAVYVYDQTGELRKRFDNEDPNREEFTYENDVIPFVEELLAEE